MRILSSCSGLNLDRIDAVTLSDVKHSNAFRSPSRNSVKMTPSMAPSRYHPARSVSLVELESAATISESALSLRFAWRMFPTFTSINRKHLPERSALFRSQQKIFRNASSERTSCRTEFEEIRGRVANLGRLAELRISLSPFAIDVPILLF